MITLISQTHHPELSHRPLYLWRSDLTSGSAHYVNISSVQCCCARDPSSSVCDQDQKNLVKVGQQSASDRRNSEYALPKKWAWRRRCRRASSQGQCGSGDTRTSRAVGHAHVQGRCQISSRFGPPGRLAKNQVFVWRIVLLIELGKPPTKKAVWPLFLPTAP
jgi:hypothetical protein